MLQRRTQFAQVSGPHSACALMSNNSAINAISCSVRCSHVLSVCRPSIPLPTSGVQRHFDFRANIRLQSVIGRISTHLHRAPFTSMNPRKLPFTDNKLPVVLQHLLSFSDVVSTVVCYMLGRGYMWNRKRLQKYLSNVLFHFARCSDDVGFFVASCRFCCWSVATRRLVSVVSRSGRDTAAP